jgi:hypothetical protein
MQIAVVLDASDRQEVFGRTLNKKCLVSESRTLENELNCCEVRKVVAVAAAAAAATTATKTTMMIIC